MYPAAEKVWIVYSLVLSLLKCLKNAVRIQVFIHNIYIDAKCS